MKIWREERGEGEEAEKEGGGGRLEDVKRVEWEVEEGVNRGQGGEGNGERAKEAKRRGRKLIIRKRRVGCLTVSSNVQRLNLTGNLNTL